MAIGNILSSLLVLIKTKSDTSGLNQTDRALKKTSQTLKNTIKDTSLLGTLGKKIFAGIGFGALAGGFNQYLQFEKDLGAIHSRFFAITNDEKKAAEEFNYIRKIAKETANDIKATADSYSIFYSSTSKTLGKEGAREVFEDWTKVGRVLHLSEYQMERVTYALREMSSKGAIYSQDLRMQIGTHVPNAMGLAQQAAEEMGFTGTDWFEKLQKAAKGNMKITTEFVKLFSKYAKQQFGSPEALRKALQQPDALAQMIRNIRTEFGVQVSQAGGKDFVVGVLKGIYDLLNSYPLKNIANILGSILGIIGKFAPEIITLLRLIVKTLIWLQVMKFLKGVNFKSWFFKQKQSIELAKVAAKAGWDLSRVKNLGILGKILFNYLTKGAIKGILSAIFVGTGPLGIIITCLMWLPDLYSLLKAIYNKFFKKENLPPLDAMLAGTGISKEAVLENLKKVNELSKQGKISDQLDLDKYLREKGLGAISSNYHYNDNKKVTINLNDTNVDLKEVQSMIEADSDNFKKKIAESEFNNPSVYNYKDWRR